MNEPSTSRRVVDEIAALRDRLRVLEDELTTGRRDTAAATVSAAAPALDAITDKVHRVTRGVFFAGLGAVELSATMARTFVDRLDATRGGDGPAPLDARAWSEMHLNASKRLVDALEGVVAESARVLDEYQATYKKRVAR